MSPRNLHRLMLATTAPVAAALLGACSPDGRVPTAPDNVDQAAVAPVGRSQQAAAAAVDHEVVINQPTESLLFIPCANGGLGEKIVLRGSWS